MTRGDIWPSELDETFGGEIQKIRPCFVISPPDMSDPFRTAIVVC